MANYTITEKFTLPSKGLIYEKPINPEVTLRSMTTMDELRRCSPSERPYSSMCDLLDDCIVNDIGINAEDLCLADYQFLLHKLRIITYGPEYKMMVRCPFCGKIEDLVFNLEELELKEYTEEFSKLFELHLPQTNKDIKLKFQTPKMLDDIVIRKQEILKKNPTALDPTLLLTLQYAIDIVDGKKLNFVQLENFVQSLPMKDANLILQRSDKINRELGLDVYITTTCSQCGLDFVSTFRETQEFFRPTND